MEERKVFILHSEVVSRDDTQDVVLWCISETEQIKVIFENEKSVFFIEKDVQDVDGKWIKKSISLKNFQNQEVVALYFKNNRELFNAKDEFHKKGIRTYENDLRLDERFLMERFISGSAKIFGESVKEGNVSVFYNPKIKSDYFFPSLSTLSLDIETGVNGELFSIAYHYKDSKGEKELVCMIGDLESTKDVLFVNSERELLGHFVDLIQEWNPDALIGWHVIGFDLKFLNDKAYKLGVNLSIDREGGNLLIVERNGKFYAKLRGRVVFDGPTVLRGAFYSFSNFKLETVAQEILGKGKDISSDGGSKVAEIERRFREDKFSLAKYNLMDSKLVTEIFDKIELIKLIINRSMISGMLLERVGFSTASFDHFLLPRLHRKGYIASSAMDISSEGSPSLGGLVFEPKMGLHKDVIVLDFKSLYPTIIRTFNIDPYSLMIARNTDDVNDILNTPVGINYSKTHTILPSFIEKLMDRRKKAKENGDSQLAFAIKILMNSFYGVMGSKNSRFYHSDLSKTITETGHWILRESKKYLETLDYEVIYGDTDSLFVKLNISDIERRFEVSRKIAENVNKYLKEKILEVYKVDSNLEIEFEKYYRKIYFSPLRGDSSYAAKKKYAGLLEDSSSRELKLSFSGLEFVRQDWTQLAKKFQYELYRKFFDEDDSIESWIVSFVDKLKNKEFDNDLVYKKRITKPLEDYVKNVPPHIKAAKLIKRSKSDFRLKEVYYIITHLGPIPVQNEPIDINYQHYIDKQIRPIADSILCQFDKSFEDVIQGNQLTFF